MFGYIMLSSLLFEYILSLMILLYMLLKVSQIMQERHRYEFNRIKTETVYLFDVIAVFTILRCIVILMDIAYIDR